MKLISLENNWKKIWARSLESGRDLEITNFVNVRKKTTSLKKKIF
jgi:hypothetical protein